MKIEKPNLDADRSELERAREWVLKDTEALRVSLREMIHELENTGNGKKRRRLAQDIRWVVDLLRDRGIGEFELRGLGYNVIHHSKYHEGHVHTGLIGIDGYQLFTTAIGGGKMR